MRKINFLVIFLALFLTMAPFLVFGRSKPLLEESFEEPENLIESSMPGRAEGEGVNFKIKNSEYLNVVLKSSQGIKVFLESIPKMISLDIESDSENIDYTELTIEGLESNKTYYKYQNSYKNKAVFVSDEKGNYKWVQDLSRPHHIWIQEIESTVFLPENCETYGTWDSGTSTCTLNQNLTESVEISADNIILDCNGHSIIGKETGYGIYLNNRKGVTIKKCIVSKFSYDIYLHASSNSIISNNKVSSSSSWVGIGLYGSSDNNMVASNNVSNNRQSGINLSGSSGNTIINNIVSRNLPYGIFLGTSSNNNLSGNKVSDNYIGIALAWSPNNTLTNNILSNNDNNFDVYGGPFANNIDTSNKINGKAIQYLVGKKDLIIDSSWDVGYLGIVDSTNITIKDLTITGNSQGILLASSTNSKIENVNVSNNDYGIYLTGSNNNNLINNIVKNNKFGGLELTSSSNNILNSNIILNNKNNGIRLSNSSNNILRNNVMNDNGSNIAIFGYPVYYRHDIDTSNTVNGKPIYYLVSEKNRIIDAFTNAGFVGVVDSTNIIVRDLTLTHNSSGIVFVNTKNSKIENITASNSDYGYGIELKSSSGNTLNSNILFDNHNGIYLNFSHENILTNNTFRNNTYGLSFWASHRNILDSNNIKENRIGVNVRQSDNNTLTGNIISYTLWGEGGIALDDKSNNNLIYHNNFIENERNAYDEGYDNSWDNSYPSGGNYWDDYNGVDANNDGIGDTPYTFKNGQDNYPFIKENGWEGRNEFDVAVILAETNDVLHSSASMSAQPCKLLPAKTYSNGYGKEYFQDLAYCVADYHRENSFGKVNLNFIIYDNNGGWFGLDNDEKYYADEDDNIKLVKDAEEKSGIDPGLIEGNKIIIVVHPGISRQEGGKIPTRTFWKGNEIIVAEKDLVGAWAHEIGHVLGVKIAPENTSIPDLYNMGDMWMEWNFGRWDIMATGSDNERGNNPPYLSSYLKEFLGWLNYDIHPKSAYGEYWINSLETSNYGDSVFRYNLSDDTQDESQKYYILETRNRTLKTWDSSLPKEKALVLYQVDTKGYPEYGYIYEGDKMMPYNQLRKINIPYFDGILTPDGDSHLDMANLVYISALSDEDSEGLYKIRVEVEKVDYNFFKNRFNGIILKPSSQFFDKLIQYFPFDYSSLKNSKQFAFEEDVINNNFTGKKLTIIEEVILYLKHSQNLFTLKSIQFDYEYDKASMGENGGPIGIFSSSLARRILIQEKSIFLGLIILLNLLIFWFNKKIISNWVSEKNKKIVKNILKVIQIIFLVIFAIVLVLLIIVLSTFFTKISANDLEVSSNYSKIASSPPLQPTTLPDLDIHLYCDDGKHIGINYQTGEFENQIEGTIVSGDNQDAPEWIFVPKNITNCHYVVSSYDNQKFLEENPEIAQQISDTKDSYEVYARYIDPETDIYTSAVLSEKIDIGESSEEPVSGTNNISVSEAIPLSVSGDANGDCNVNVLDLTFVRNKIGQNINVGINKKADVNEDGKMNVQDLVVVRNNLGKSCAFSQKPSSIPGDANLDCKVDTLDLVFIMNRLGKDISLNDNWQADVNQDNKINILDLMFVRKYLGTSCG